MIFLALTAVGIVAGVIDSIAGGGGLVTVPTLLLIFGSGVTAVATNKIAGFTAAAIALLVYIRNGHFDLKQALTFTLWVGLGSFIGSRTAIYFPPEVFRALLLVSCPLILWIVWKKELWTHVPSRDSKPRPLLLAIIGILCGFYDGAWGPGGGTFMFLGLSFVVKLPLLQSIAASKLANSVSALVSLVSYSVSGYVMWAEGTALAVGIGIGAFIGASVASRNAARVVRPVLAIVTLLLLAKLLFSK